jgi:hypothetical protein
MVELSEVDIPQLAEAVIIWTSWGRNPWPHRDDTALLERFGPAITPRLLSTIKALQAEFYASNAAFTVADLGEAGREASRQFKEKYPLLPGEVAEAFAWCYTYDWK